MTKSFRDEYGAAVDLPVNAVAYEMTDGGDTVRHRPDLWPDLQRDVVAEIRRFPDLGHMTDRDIQRHLERWLEVNEGRA
jgi:hypothetical protein